MVLYTLSVDLDEGFGRAVRLLLVSPAVLESGNVTREVHVPQALSPQVHGVLSEGLIDQMLVHVLPEDLAFEALAEVHDDHVVLAARHQSFLLLVRGYELDCFDLAVLQVLFADFLHHVAQIVQRFLLLDELL